MSRTLLTAPTAFYCNAAAGSLANDGLSVATPLPQPQDVVHRLYASYDLGYNQVRIVCAPNQNYKTVSLSGPMVGAQGRGVILDVTGATITPVSNGVGTHGSYGIELNFGAALTLHNAVINNHAQIAAGGHHLFLGTPLDNVRDSVKKGRRKNGRKRGPSKAIDAVGSPHKLTADVVREILASQLPGRAIARAFGVSPKTVRDLRQKRTWKHLSVPRQKWNSAQSKLTQDEANDIRHFHALSRRRSPRLTVPDGVIPLLCEAYGVSRRTICDVAAGRRFNRQVAGDVP